MMQSGMDEEMGMSESPPSQMNMNGGIPIGTNFPQNPVMNGSLFPQPSQTNLFPPVMPNMNPSQNVPSSFPVQNSMATSSLFQAPQRNQPSNMGLGLGISNDNQASSSRSANISAYRSRGGNNRLIH